MGYLDAKGRVVSDFKSIALHYLKKPLGFPLDLIAALPLEIIALPIPHAHTRTAVLLYCRIIHAIRIVRIKEFFTVEEKRLNQKSVRLAFVPLKCTSVKYTYM